MHKFGAFVKHELEKICVNASIVNGRPAELLEVEAGHTGDGDVVGIGRASALRTYHDAALRPGQSSAARDGEGGERGCGSTGTEQDRGGSWAGLASGAARLLHPAAVGRTMDT